MEKVNVPPDALQQIFQMQKALMEHYIRIEGLPSYPLPLEEKSSQKTIKDFKERILEELSEAYERLLQIWIDTSNNTEYDREEALAGFNEELADVLHFFIETLIFSGVEWGEIRNFLKGIEEDNETEMFFHPTSTWLTLCHFASHQNLNDNLSFSQVINYKGFRVIEDSLLNSRPELSGGRVVSNSIMATHAEYCWELCFMLNKSIAFLKNKPWAQSERTANILAYKQSLMETFLHFFRYLDFMGQTPAGIYTAYYLKNQILQKRIKDGY